MNNDFIKEKIQESNKKHEKMLQDLHDYFENRPKMKWGYQIDSNGKSFLLGANVNIGLLDDGHCYLILYLGFITLVIGRDNF